MNKNLRTGLLSAILIVPVLIFLFLHFFGKNHFTLPKYYPLDVIDGDTLYHTIPDFSLLSQDSVLVSKDSFKGKILVFDFMFSRCPGPCPKMGVELKRVQNAFKNINNVHILSISVDTAFDSPSVLKNYAKKVEAKPYFWDFLTGNKQDIVYLCKENGFKLPLYIDVSDPNSIDHSSKFILVDTNWVIRGYYSGTDTKEVDRLITEIHVLLHELNN